MTKAGLQSVILAAGKGTRMKSARAKVLHEVLGVPLLEHVVRTVASLHPDPLTLVVGHQAEAVAARLQRERPASTATIERLDKAPARP